MKEYTKNFNREINGRAVIVDDIKYYDKIEHERNYYERFFEIIKNPTRSISKGTGLSWDARIIKDEKEMPKRRAEIFLKLKQGEFITFTGGKEKNILNI